MVLGAVVFLSVIIAPVILSGQQPAWPPAPGHTQIPIWPNGAPGAVASGAAEADTTTAKDRDVAVLASSSIPGQYAKSC